MNNRNFELKTMGKTLIILSVMTLLNINVYAQGGPEGIWYFKRPGGEMSSRVVVSPNSITYEDYQTYEVEKPYWKKDKSILLENTQRIKNGFRLIGNENGKYYGGDFWFSDDKQQFFLYQMRQGADSEKEIIKLLTNKKNKVLLSRVAYKKERLEEILSYPSLDKLNKDGVIEILNHMYSFEDDVANAGEEQRIIWRMGQNILSRKFILMGFDPDKPTEGYFLKKFIDDPDIAELVKKQVHLKMY